MANDVVRLPSGSDRTSIVGRTGSGKTVAAVFQLSMQAIDQMPWVILDYKRDELINDIAVKLNKARYITFADLPKKPGIYILNIMPGEAEADKLTAWLWRVWEEGGIGVYIDEGYMIHPRNPALNALLTQGRSKGIPMIILSQRPVYMSRFVFSEASFFQVFDLTHDKDKEKVSEYIKGDTSKELPDYHSYWYDVAKKKLATFAPVPSGKTILETIDGKLPRLKRTL